MVETGTSHFSRFESSVCCLRSPHPLSVVVSFAGSVLCAGCCLLCFPMGSLLKTASAMQSYLQFVERCQSWKINYLLFTVYCLLFTFSWRGPHTEMAGFCFWRLKSGSFGNIYKKMSNLSQFTVLIMHFVEKMLLFNREVRYQIYSGSGLAGSGSEMIYSGS